MTLLKAHIFGRARKGDREEVNIKFFNPDGTPLPLGDLPINLAVGSGVPGFDFPDTYPLGTLYMNVDFPTGASYGLYVKTDAEYDVTNIVSDPESLPNHGITGWIQISGHNSGWPTPGVSVASNGSLVILTGPGKNASITDPVAFAGSGNGIYWNWFNTSVDGDQQLAVQVGPGGSKKWIVSDQHGTLGGNTPPPGGIKFPTTNPHIAGAWWDNAGVLTKSTG